MRNIREILLTQYIGAIAIGLILAQAVFNFVAALIQAGAAYIAIQQSKSVLVPPRSFSWNNLITSMVEACLYLGIGFALIRWLYASSPEEPDNSEDLPPESAQP